MANIKYLIIGDKCVTVKIDRANFSYTKELYYRLNGGKENTIKLAIHHRDYIHKSKFGYPVGKRFFHSQKKKVKSNPRSQDLPPGISYGYSRGELLYVVASWAPLPNRIMRKRFNIKKLGLDKAISTAINFRMKKITEIIDSD